jgi:menaquinone-9 beta-reductase
LLSSSTTYDSAIIGGGLAGLSLAIQLSRQGHSVILFEKEKYPFHKVCGEYISLESWDFLENLGLDLDELQVSMITKLQVSTVSGKLLQQNLPLGGFGISRYKIDAVLAEIAKQNGVTILENCPVREIKFENDSFHINSANGVFGAKTAAGCYGKRSKIDVQWKRPFTQNSKSKLNNYIGVKYHVRSIHRRDTIALHLFHGGYCGIVKVEGDVHCLCYLTTAANLLASGNNIKKMESALLRENPFLEKIFSEAEFLWDQPLVISQISFDEKTQVENHMLMVGDAAGMITPLCGNGMSMALHGSKLAAEKISDFLIGDIHRDEMEKSFVKEWKKHFSRRLSMGRRIQKMFGNEFLISSVINIGKRFPSFTKWLIRQTHGTGF